MCRCVALSVLVMMGGCVDDRLAFRADALDVSGQWQLTSPTIATAEVEIVVETDVNDLRLVLRRSDAADAVTADEADVIGRLRDANVRLQARSALELGAGIDDVRSELVGGENVSFDGGRTTSVDVVSGAFAASADGDDGDDGGDDSLVRWGMSLHGDDAALVGELFVTERRRTQHLGTTETTLTTQRSNAEVTLSRR